MGMFDKPKYLTGQDGFASPGDVFWLHQAALDGTVEISGDTRDQAKLQVSKSRDGEKETVYTSGVGIVNQIRRMSDDDKRGMPMQVRLDQVESKHGSPTNVLAPASAPVGAVTSGDDDIPF